MLVLSTTKISSSLLPRRSQSLELLLRFFGNTIIHLLTPSFEATRIKLLPIPSASDIVFAEWSEDVNPYEVAVSALSPHVEGHGTIFVDGSIRHFIVDGLIGVASKFKVLWKLDTYVKGDSLAEIEPMKCANEAEVFFFLQVPVIHLCLQLTCKGR